MITKLLLEHAHATRTKNTKRAEKIRRELLEDHGVGHRWLSDTVLLWVPPAPPTVKKRRKK